MQIPICSPFWRQCRRQGIDDFSQQLDIFRPSLDFSTTILAWRAWLQECPAWDPVYPGPDKCLTRTKKFLGSELRLHVFKRQGVQVTDRSRSKCFLVRFNFLVNSCKHFNRTIFCTVCVVKARSQVTNYSSASASTSSGHNVKVVKFYPYSQLTLVSLENFPGSFRDTFH